MNLKSLLLEPLNTLQLLSDSALTDHGVQGVFPDSLKGLTKGLKPSYIVRYAYCADAFRMAIDTIFSDGVLSQEESEAVVPFVRAMAKLLKPLIPVYEHFENGGASECERFFKLYQTETATFGYANPQTKWAGAQIAKNCAKLTGSKESVVVYKSMLDEVQEAFLIIPQFDSNGWTLPTQDEVDWTVLLKLAGVPRETSLLTKDEWKSAIKESRVVSILHSGDGMSYIGKVSHMISALPGNYCRVAFERSLPPDLSITGVDVTDIDTDFDAVRAVRVAANHYGEKLLEACRNGDFDAAKSAIKYGADLNYADHDETPASKPLLAAIEQGSKSIVQLLLESGLTDNRDHAWDRAMVACQTEIAELLKGHGFDADHGSALLLASSLGRLEAIEILAKLTDLNKEYFGSQSLYGTPLIVAARNGQAETVALLIKQGANPNHKIEGVTPWMAATATDHNAVAEQLVQAGARPDLNAALQVACEWGILNVIRKLVEHGADVNATPEIQQQRMPSIHRCLSSYSWSEHCKFDAVEFLVLSGANIKATDEKGNSVLHTAVNKDLREAIQILAKLGATIESRDKNGDTPLICAIQYGKLNVLWQLLSCGADPNATDKSGDPAMFAMFREYGSFNQELAKILLAFGVDLTAKNTKGWSLRKRCQREVDNASDEGFSEECCAQEFLDFLNDDEMCQGISNLMLVDYKSAESVKQACFFTSQVMENAELIQPIIENYISINKDEAIDLLEALGDHEDWQIRVATVSAIEPYFGKELSPELVIGLLSASSFDIDSDDVTSAADQILLRDLDLTTDLLVSQFVKDPLSARPAEKLLVRDAFNTHRNHIISKLQASLPSNPDSLVGRDRISAGRLYNTITALESEDSREKALEYGKLAIRLDPDLGRTNWPLIAELLKEQGEPEMSEALDLYIQSTDANSWEEKRGLLEQSVAADPTFFWSYNDLAWHMAAAEIPTERNGGVAVSYALKACELDCYQYWGVLDTLAAAYAENGQFDKAVEWLINAIAKCPEDTMEMQALLERYRNHESYPYPDLDDDGDDDWDEDENDED